MKQMTVGRLMNLLKECDGDEEIYMTSRIQQDTHITAINYVGVDRHGNLVITLDDSLLNKEESI